MENRLELRQKATELRKAKKYAESLSIYKSLWDESFDKMDGAGYLQCLRKAGNLKEALAFISLLKDDYTEFDFMNKEIIWTLTDSLKNEKDLEKILEISKQILARKPDLKVSRTIVLKVLKSAKDSQNWLIIKEWLPKVKPESLDNVVHIRGKKNDWTDKAVWYNLKISSLIEEQEFEKAILLVDNILPTFRNLTKYFTRLKARALIAKGDLRQAEDIYTSFCTSEDSKTDWYLFNEYADILAKLDKKPDALLNKYKAASRCPSLKILTKTIKEIAELNIEFDNQEDAFYHFLLYMYIRDENNLKIEKELNSKLYDLKAVFKLKSFPEKKDTIHYCKRIWGQYNPAINSSKDFKSDLEGKVVLGSSDKLFCFIKDKNGLVFFCLKEDLPKNTKNNSRVIFDAVSSFDKKKNKVGWKARNIRLA